MNTTSHETRVAEALRDNLRKRKAQQQAKQQARAAQDQNPDKKQKEDHTCR